MPIDPISWHNGKPPKPHLHLFSVQSPEVKDLKIGDEGHYTVKGKVVDIQDVHNPDSGERFKSVRFHLHHIEHKKYESPNERVDSMAKELKKGGY